MDTKAILPKYIGIVAILVFVTSLLRTYIGITIIRALIDGFNPDFPIALSWAEAVTSLLAGTFGVIGSANLMKISKFAIILCWACIGFNILNILISFSAFQISAMQYSFFDSVGIFFIRFTFTLIFAFLILKAQKAFQAQQT